MANTILSGQRHWSLVRDDNGFRDYRLVLRVRMDSPLEGPASAITTPGLPLPGAAWVVDNDFDLWVWCRPTCRVSPVVDDGDPNSYFDLEYTFSNRFDVGSGGSVNPGGTDGGGGGSWRCHTQQLDNPLLMPPKISGGFTKYREEQGRDMFGKPILNSAFERIRGPQVEFDRSKPTVKIEQNVLDLQLPVLMAMKDTVNADVLWGLPRRCVKLAPPQWAEQYYGTCTKYYTRTLDFEIDLQTHDRLIMDEGGMALSGEWSTAVGQQDTWVLININGSPPDPTNPKHFVTYKDRDGHPARTMLNGGGLPAGSVVASGNKYIATSGIGVNIDPGVVGETQGWLRFTLQRGAWGLVVEYFRGDVVTFNTVQYLAVGDNSGTPPPSNAANWQALTGGVKDRGYWDATKTYLAGDIVQTKTGTKQGAQIVRFYQESDFLLLGIPATIG